MRSAALKAAAKDHISLSIHNGLNHKREFLRVVFQVCILNNANVSSLLQSPCSELLLCLCFFVIDDVNIIFTFNSFEDFTSAIG